MKGSMSNMEQTYIALLLICIFYLRGCLCDTNLTKDMCGFSGESVSLSCTLPTAEFVQQLAWSNDIIIGDISSCTTGGCTPPANNRYAASANTNGIYMTITSLTRAVDETTWQCTLQGQPPSTISLTVRDYPTTCVLSKNSDGSFKCETDCGYPTSDLTIDWFLNTTSAVVDLSNPSIAIDTTSTPACSSGGKASTTLPESNINEDGDLYCKCGMQTACPQQALIVSGSEAVTASSSSSICDSCTTTNVLAALGIVVAVVCVALCWIMFFQLSGKLQDLDSALIKSKCSVKQTLIAAIIATSLCVIGIILCIVALVTVAIALAVVGLVLPVVTLVIVIILLTFFCRGKDGDDDYIKILKTSYAITEGTTFTIPCSASSAASAATATSFSWERTIDGRTSPIRIDGAHFSEVTTGSPSLTIINASITDSGTYTCVASNSAGTARASTQLTVSKRNPEHTETNQVNPKNVTDDEKFVKKGETTDDQKATVVEMKGIDKNDKNEPSHPDVHG